MSEDEWSDGPDVVDIRNRPALQRRQCRRSTSHGEVGPVTVHPHLGACVGDQEHQGPRHPHLPHGRPRPEQGRLEVALLRAPVREERLAVVLEHGPPLDDRHALIGDGKPLDIDAEPEPVQQLGAHVPLLGVHRPDEDEAGRVRIRDALTFHRVHTHGRGVQQRVHQMVVEQVDLVDVEDAAVGRRHQTRLEPAFPMLESVLHVERTDEPVLGGGHGQLDHARTPCRAREIALGRAYQTLVAEVGGVVRIAGEPALGHDLDGWQDSGQRADGRGLRSALLTPDEHASDPRVDGVDEQRGLEGLLTYDRAERERGCVPCHTDFHWKDPQVAGPSCRAFGHVSTYTQSSQV
jgi:hypothetical protein